MCGDKRELQPSASLPQQFTMQGGSMCGRGPGVPPLIFHRVEGMAGGTYRATLGGLGSKNHSGQSDKSATQ